MLVPPGEWIERIIKIDSITDKSNEAVVSFLIPLLKESGLKVEEQKVVENGITFKNLLAYNETLDSHNLIALNTHLDTVSFGSKDDWTKTDCDPFKATRVRDRIYGLGTADVKLDFLCKIWAARLARPWKRPFVLVGTYGEERGLIGIQKLFEAKKIKPKFALVGEPSDLELIYAHKGHVIVTLSLALKAEPPSPFQKSWKGKSAHSSTPHLGNNALLKGLTEIFKHGRGIVSLSAGTGGNSVPDYCTAVLCENKNETSQQLFSFIHDLKELERDLRKRKDARFSPSHCTLSLNHALSRDGKLFLTFDIRPLPDTNLESLRKRVEALASDNRMKIESLSIDQPLKGHKNGRFIVEAAHHLKEAGAKVVKKTKASSTEAALYSANGAEAIVFGPGISVGNVHRPNEFNSLRQISVATKFYASLLKSKVGEA